MSIFSTVISLSPATSATSTTATAASSPQSATSPLSTEKQQLAELLRPIFQGYRTRNQVINPHRMIEIINLSYAHMTRIDQTPTETADLDVYGISILLSRKVMELAKDRKNWGTVINVDSLKGYLGWYYRESGVYRSDDPYHLAFDVDLRVEIAPNGKAINLHFKPIDSQLLGKGGFKITYEAEDTYLSLNPINNNQGKWSRITAGSYTVRKILHTPQTAESINIQRLTRGAKIHQSCYLKLLSAKEAGEAQGVYLSKPEIPIGNGETRQLRYDKNLSKARREGAPLSKLLEYTLNAARTFEWLNRQGITHRDGTSANINLCTTESEGTVAGLADFDFAKEGFGVDSLNAKDDYYVWDPCAVYANFATPYLDLYAAATLLCRTMIPQLSQIDPPIAVLDPNDFKIKMAAMCDYKLLRYVAVCLIGQQQPFDLSPFLTKYNGRHPQRPLSGNQKKVLEAFCRISYESAMLLLQCDNLFKERSNFSYPQDVGHQEILEAMESLKEKELFPGSGTLNYTFTDLITLITEIQQSL